MFKVIGNVEKGNIYHGYKIGEVVTCRMVDSDGDTWYSNGDIIQCVRDCDIEPIEGVKVDIGWLVAVRYYQGKFWMECEVQDSQQRREISMELAYQLIADLGLTYDEVNWLQYDHNRDYIKEDK